MSMIWNTLLERNLENEVIEQEVYGIDPSTHNLLLDSMPAELDWSLQEKTQSFGHWICKLGILVELEPLQ